MEEKERMFLEERRDRICDIVNRQKRTTISELSQFFKLGEATIRRDLGELELRGLIRRTHGGAIPAEKSAEEIAINVREGQKRAEKERIAEFIARLVRNGESLMIDGGTTTHMVARALKTKSNLMVVTNSPLVATEFLDNQSIQVILTGGLMQDKTMVTIGPITDLSLKQFRVDRVIIGMSTLLPSEGFFTVSHFEAEVKRTMISLGKETIVAMDSSKFGKSGFSFVAGFEQVDKLVTDSGISQEDLAALEKTGMEIVTV